MGTCSCGKDVPGGTLCAECWNEIRLKDSGQRETFPTGAIREPNLGRGRYDLIPPIALKALAIHYERGAKKYEDRNWENGLPLSRHLNSALRHLQNYLAGDREEDHLSACVFNCFAITHDLEMIKKGAMSEEINDLPYPGIIKEVKPIDPCDVPF
jgi:hypothetical protein